MRVRAQAWASSAAIVAGPRIAWRRAPQMHGRENGSGRSGVRRASRQHNACSVCRARRRGGRAHENKRRGRGRALALRPAAVLSRAACGHDAAKHGQPRYGERDHRTPASACEKALWQLAESVAERVAKGVSWKQNAGLRSRRDVQPLDEQAPRASSNAGTKRDRKAWAGVGRTAHFEGDRDRIAHEEKVAARGQAPYERLRRDTARGERQEEPQQREQRTLLPDCLGERDEANAGRRTVVRSHVTCATLASLARGSDGQRAPKETQTPSRNHEEGGENPRRKQKPVGSEAMTARKKAEAKRHAEKRGTRTRAAPRRAQNTKGIHDERRRGAEQTCFRSAGATHGGAATTNG
ncbi:hypothetical protein ERJ75_000635800 [Trypanosoma vivax]|nr:hypothetical protein ERJ75_000635800 [Trypanosoma vivax]